MGGILQSDLWRFARQRPAMVFGFLVITVNLGLALFGPTIAPFPTQAPSGPALDPPGSRHWFGTDASGMDVFSRVLAARRIDFAIALVSTTIAFCLGVSLGVVSGYFAQGRPVGRAASALIMRAAELFQSFPIFVFALAPVGFSGPSLQNVIMVLAFSLFGDNLRIYLDPTNRR